MANLTSLFPQGFKALPSSRPDSRETQIFRATPTPREAAEQYIAAGMKLCAIAHGSKGPNYQQWERYALDIDHINGRGLGLLHALSGTCAIDIDDLHESGLWLATRGIDLAGLLDADDAVQIQSGRVNRAKLLYRLPIDVNTMPTRKLKTYGGATMIEFRCASNDGSSVQDVLPPTIHPDTREPYQWGGNGDFTELPELPDMLRALWESLDSDRKTSAPTAVPTPDGLIREGGRNDALYKKAGDMARLGLPLEAIDAALQALNTTRCTPPLPSSEISTIARSASVTSHGAREAAARTRSKEWPDPTPLPASLPAVPPFSAELLPVELRRALCRFVWNATITPGSPWASGGHSSPRPSRQRKGSESPSAVRVADHKSHG